MRMIEPFLNLKRAEFFRPAEWNPKRGQGRILCHYIFSILPRIKKQLGVWEEKARRIPNHELRCQALASLRLKAFHCQGGAVLAIGSPRYEMNLIRIFTAYQTLCDYLDNLCDRAGETNGQAFLLLHQSLLAALDAERPQPNYYELYPYKDDGGYISDLVEECRQGLSQLSSYSLVKEDVLRLVDYYIQLQVNKHLSWEIRENCLESWVDRHLEEYPGLWWNEWAAATGSTLAVFALLNLAGRPDLQAALVRETGEAYFPWICALHILLDYFIDQEEDRVGGDLNFVFYYPDKQKMQKRLKMIIGEARERAEQLPDFRFHLTVVQGLLAMYFSDEKVVQQGLRKEACELIRECGGSTNRIYILCRLVRKLI